MMICTNTPTYKLYVIGRFSARMGIGGVVDSDYMIGRMAI